MRGVIESSRPLSSSSTAEMLQCARFFNNEMNFDEQEQIDILTSLQEIGIQERRQSFDDVISCRKRDQKKWQDMTMWINVPCAVLLRQGVAGQGCEPRLRL